MVARKDGRTVVFGFDVGDRDELHDAARFVFHREELLVLFHRGLKDLWWQAQEVFADVAYQNHGPFDETRDFGKKTFVFNDFEAICKSHLRGVVPDLLGAFFG